MITAGAVLAFTFSIIPCAGRRSTAAGRNAYWKAALSGARYLLSIAATENDTCLIYHIEPDGTDLHDLDWCHGPVGTANLFRHLAEMTGDPVWSSWVNRQARSLMISGIPGKETPGFWNNAGLCCGLAGTADFFLYVYRLSGDKEHLDFGRRILKVLRAKAAAEDDRLKWIQAEHRTRPDFLAAQTGLMQGAAGR